MTSNPAYDIDLAKLKRNNYAIITVVLVICVVIYIGLFEMLGFKGNVFIFSLSPIFLIAMFYLQDKLKEDQMELMLKHGLVDRKWKADTEQRFNEIATRLSSALNAKQRKVEIVDDAGVFSCVEPRLSNSLAIPLKVARELDDKQLEFLIANALVGFNGRLLVDRYAIVLLYLPGALFLPFVSSVPKEMLPLYGGIVISLIILAGLLAIRSLVGSNKIIKSPYARILAVTKDPESAESALIAQSKLSLQRMSPKTIEILRSGYHKWGVPEDELESSLLGADVEINKLRKAAVEAEPSNKESDTNT